MKIKNLRLPFALLLLTGVFAGAQESALPAQPARTPQELEQLVAPIALYPDALIALILPAASAPTDIVLAARHVRENPGDRTQIEHRAWDESVKSLTHYPEIVVWMDENLTWTKQIGEAFAVQPAETMQAVQRLRAQARAAGTLVDTPQQQVLAEPNVIRIVPAQPDIIYVPHYEPSVVFVDRPVYYSRPYLSFGVGAAIGSWLAFDCDWRRNAIWVGNRHRPWHGHDWRRPLVSYAPVGPAHIHGHGPVVRQWRPPHVSHRPTVPVTTYRRAGIAQPAPISAVFGRGGDSRASSSHSRGPNNNNAANPPTPGATPSQRSNSGNSRNGNGFVGPTAPTSVVAPPLPTARIAAPLAQTVPTPPPVTSRRNNPDTTRTTPAQRSYSGGARNEFTGPTAPTAVVAPPLPTARIAAPLAQTVPTPPPAAPRRNNPDATRDNDVRNRSYRGNPPAAPVANTVSPPTVRSFAPPAPAAHSPAPRLHTPAPRSHPRADAPTYAPQSRSVVSPPPHAAPTVSSAPAAAVTSPAPANSSAPARSAPAPTSERRGGRRDDPQR